MARKNPPAPLEGTVVTPWDPACDLTDSQRLDALALLLRDALLAIEQLEQDKNDSGGGCQGLEQRLQTVEKANAQLHERVAVLEAKKGSGSNGSAQAGLAPKVGEPQDDYTCAVADAAGQPHGPCRLNRFGNCPQCFSLAALLKSQSR